MKVHRNAKTTPSMRALMVDEFGASAVVAGRGGGRSGHQCAEHVQVAARYREGGRAGAADQASTPHRQPRRTTPAVTARILAHAVWRAARAARMRAVTAGFVRRGWR